MNRASVHPRAFSLLEVVTVVTVLGIVAAIAVPLFAKTTARQRVSLAAARVAADLKYASTLARETSIARTVTISGRVLTITPMTPGFPATRLDDWPFTLEQAVADFAGATEVTFDSWGMPQKSGNIVLGLGAYQRTVTVNATTGEVSY
ncbi:MAG TPA: prepilin-type N-terminal cleavage/methylation domain-containing protein [Tepidisphaeraceae bacterium]|nr:prepilin-type N-terminal cleavage/methylation domain-containing protein [Tepidisphaeraceae bacterium]